MISSKATRQSHLMNLWPVLVVILFLVNLNAETNSLVAASNGQLHRTYIANGQSEWPFAWSPPSESQSLAPDHRINYFDAKRNYIGDPSTIRIRLPRRTQSDSSVTKIKSQNSNAPQNGDSSQKHVIVIDNLAEYRQFLRHKPISLLYETQRGEADVETFYIRKGANGTLPCLPVSPGDSQAAMNKIEWLKEDKKLVEAESKRIVVWNTKNTIAYLPETGALLFRGVSNEDSGEYHCLLTKLEASGTVTEDGVVRFYVQDVPDPPKMPVVIGFTQRTVNLSWVPSYDYHYSPVLHYIIHTKEGAAGQWDIANGIMTPDNRSHYQVIGLKPFTTYAFRVLAVNAIGPSEPSPPSYNMITLRQVPDTKLNIISARNVSSTSIKIEWEPPSAEQIHGEFIGYRIRYVQQPHEYDSAPSNPSSSQTGDYYNYNQNRNKPLKPVAPSLDSPQANAINVGDTKSTSYVIKNLNVFTLYKVGIEVVNLAGYGPVQEVLAMTDEGAASQPTDLSIIRTLDTAVKLRWSEPKSPNGILQGYQILLHDISNNLNDTRKLSNPEPVMEYTINELTPYTWYTLQVQAYSSKYFGDLSQSIKFRTDVSAPSAPILVNVTCSFQDSILIQWQRPERFYNQLDYYYVQYKPDSAWQFEETTLAAKRDKLLNELLITNLTTDLLYELKVIAGTKSILDSNIIYKSEPSLTFRVVLQDNCERKNLNYITSGAIRWSRSSFILRSTFCLIQ